MTTTRDWMLPLSFEAAQAFAAHYIPAIEARREALGLEPTDLSLAQAAVAAEPAALTPARVLERIPYMSAAQSEAELAAAAERGALARDDGGYRATEDGRMLVHEVVESVARAAAEVGERTPAGMDRLAELLGRLVAACEQAAIATPSLGFSRTFDPGPDALPLARIRRYINDLTAFRDDAHVAAWQPYGISGAEWELFSHVWGENVWGDPVGTAPEAAEKLGFRGYGEADYAAMLADLAGRGWLGESDGRYALTDAGRALRAEAEAATDRNFFAPWDLSAGEEAELRAGLEAMREGLRVESPEADG